MNALQEPAAPPPLTDHEILTELIAGPVGRRIRLVVICGVWWFWPHLWPLLVPFTTLILLNELRDIVRSYTFAQQSGDMGN